MISLYLGDPVQVVPPEPPQGLPRLGVPRLADQPVRRLWYPQHPDKVEDGKGAEHRCLYLEYG